MKTFISKIKLVTTALAVLLSISSFAQRTITGTVYMSGEPAAGITVEANKSKESMMTSFDGQYSITVGEGGKWISFTFIDETKKYDISADPSDVINFSFDGSEIPVAKVSADGADLRSAEDLQKANETEFLSPYTMYTQFYNQGDYDSALPYWEKVYEKYPAALTNIYIHGAKMYQDKVEKAKDPKTRDQYIDTLMTVYDKRIEHFDQRGYVLGRKAVAYLDYKINNDISLSDEELKKIFKTAYNELEESVKLEKENTEAAVLVLYMQTTRRLFMMNELERATVAENYNTISEIVDANLAKGEDEEKYTATKETVDKLFQTSGAADCETLIALYEPKFGTISQDIEELKKMLRVLDKQDCTESELYASASEVLYDLEPSSEAAYNMARLFVKRNEFDRAKEYYLKAIADETDKELLSTYYYQLGAFTLINDNAVQQAYNYTQKSISNNPSNGDAYILQGDILAQYAPSYGDTDFDHKAVYWLAVDKYEKAKAVDPDTFQKANQKINAYKPYFPGSETMFMSGVTKGDKYKIEGWINETTTAR